jgi:hypothetical protein
MDVTIVYRRAELFGLQCQLPLQLCDESLFHMAQRRPGLSMDVEASRSYVNGNMLMLGAGPQPF